MLYLKLNHYNITKTIVYGYKYYSYLMIHQINNYYSISYVKYFLYDDPIYYYFDRYKPSLLDKPNHFIKYINECFSEIKSNLYSFLSKTYNCLDFDKQKVHLKHILKYHNFDAILNPKLSFLNFTSESFFLIKSSSIFTSSKDIIQDEQYIICIPTVRLSNNKKYYEFISKYYYYGLLNLLSKNTLLSDKISNVVCFLPIQDNYINSDNFIKYTITKDSYTKDSFILDLSYIYNFITTTVPKLVIGKTIFPNMKNTMDYPYHSIKKKISQESDEITQYYFCSSKSRSNYLKSNRFKPYNKNCTKSMKYSCNSFGIKSGKSNIIDSILKNRGKSLLSSSNEENTYPELEIPYNKINIIKNTLKYIKNTYENLCFFDFEVVNNIISKDSIKNFPFLTKKTIIFNIGMYVLNINTNKLEYFSYYIHNSNNISLDAKAEFNMMTAFYNKINSLTNPILIHWSNAELSFLRNYTNRTIDNIAFDNFNFFDLYEFILKNEIIFKGMKSFKLKEIISLFKSEEYDKIPVNLTYYQGNVSSSRMLKTSNTNIIEDGLDTIGVYLLDKENTHSLDIIDYNKKDCVYLYQIFELLNNNSLCFSI